MSNSIDEAPLDVASALEWSELERVARAVQRRRRVAVGGLWGASQALFLAGLVRRAQGPWVVVCSNELEAEVLREDLEVFGAQPTQLPAREGSGRAQGGRDVDLDSVRRRLQAAAEFAGPPEGRPRLVVASLLSLLQPIPSAQAFEQGLVALQRGEHLETEHLLRRLVDAGYTRQPLVERAGEVSLRGDILDVFPFAEDLPVRVELFDDEIESLRRFDPVPQTSVETLEQVAISLTSDAGGVEDGDGVRPIDLLSPAAVVVEIEPLRLEDESEGLRIRSASHQRELGVLRADFAKRTTLALQSLPSRDVDADTRSVQSLGVGVREVGELLRAELVSGMRVVVPCRNEAERQRFRGVLEETDGLEAVETPIGNVSRGFRLPSSKLVVVNHRELAGVQGARRATTAKKSHRTRALQSFFELKAGDYVVHAVHGLALFRGLARMQRGGGEEEHLHLEFADSVSLFVPGSRIDLVQRYIGAGGMGRGGKRGRKSAAPALDKIGGASFRRRRERVERALRDLAADLIEVQAKRELERRDPWRPDAELVRDLVASFQWSDTPDQEIADGEITADLASEHVMDRLLCGDVGFGKTEIAVRAAFRVAAAGGQVAVLVPTTVLAHQHGSTFQGRLADFPLEVAVLSRTIKGREAREVLERVEQGAVDVLIGTHRLLSKDVRFKRLGLVIVDEEQRFGVAHKEHFKTLRSTVDVLTLSATPIPRTLHMSLSGVRDISALSTPPPGRQEIETVLIDSEDDSRIRDALLREKLRGGQSFFLHNRVHDLGAVVTRLQRLVPEVSILVGHGQMSGRELDRVMDAFSRGDADVLLATTIVENGLDIPAAGTILIDDADHFGLAELHQLRGRVGRGEHKAHCFLLVPKYRPVRESARERLKALEEMNHLGSGFQISMKDLEIRGAGNLLGPEQSGHIAAVGYDMYCRLLKLTIERIKAGLDRDAPLGDAELAPGVELELGLSAFLPDTWIGSSAARLEALRALDAAEDDAELAAAADGLRDRYGRPPAEAEALVRQFRLRSRLAALGVTRLAWRGDRYLIEYDDRVALEALAGADVELRPLRTGVAGLMVPAAERAPEAALRWVERLLNVPQAPSTMRAERTPG